MRKLLTSLLFCLWLILSLSKDASAGVSCSLPFNLQNNTVADATQVMANYNALVTCLGNAAGAGVNNDITQLLGLLTPLGPTFGGTSAFVGVTSTGAPNAQVITVTPSSFSLTVGTKISFTSGFTNTGATTVNANGSGVIPVLRTTITGTAFLVGEEFIIGGRMNLEYDGVNWQIMGQGVTFVGRIYDYVGVGCPTGSLPALGQTVLRTSPLGIVLAGLWGTGDGSTTYNLPDLRGRAGYGQDLTNGGLANRITVAGGNFDGTVIGNVGGLQNSNSVGAHVHTITDPGHVHTVSGSTVSAASAVNVYSGGTGGLVQNPTINSATTGISVNSAGATYSILAPAAIVNKCVQQ